MERRASLASMLRLAVPVVIGELGWILMPTVDTAMVGVLGPEALGAVGVGRSLFWVVGAPAAGLLYGLDTLVSHAHGGERRQEARSVGVAGLWLALFMALPGMALFALGEALVPSMGLTPVVVEPTRDYMRYLIPAVPALLAYTALRRYLQAVDRALVVMVTMIVGNLVNVVVNYALIEGRLGFPALGVKGAALATVFSLGFMGLVLAAAIALRSGGIERLRATRWRIDRGRLKPLVELGWPAASQVFFEVGAFAAGTVLVGRLGAIPLAAHQIALQLATVTFKVPQGLSAAAAVRVGQHLGRGDGPGARRAGWSALFLAAVFMSAMALLFAFAPRLLIAPFSSDPEVVGLAVTLLLIAGLFQLFDGIQVVATGALRGLGETRVPMLWNVVGYWGLCLPLGTLLAFRTDLGVVGFWIGFLCGLVGIGSVLLGVWRRRASAL